MTERDALISSGLGATVPDRRDGLDPGCAGIRVAALFVQRDGCYFGLPGVDPWPEDRDARLYAGPWPVVAHPPCQLWVNFAALNFKRYGGEHNRPGNDGGCFASALASVRRWGGVLEHPTGSKAWAAHGLPRPRGRGWQRLSNPNRIGFDLPRLNEWVAEVWQSAYGHRARKRTWLFAVTPNPPPLDRRAPAGEAQVGWFDRIKPTLSKREASATPPAFRDLLIEIAASARTNASQPEGQTPHATAPHPARGLCKSEEDRPVAPQERETP